MGVLKGLAAAILLGVAVPVVSQTAADVAVAEPDRRQQREIDKWSPDIREASGRFGIPEVWIRRVIRAESGGRTHLGGRPITSRAGAMGLMQLMPGTWAEMRSKYGLGADPHDPRDNILAGTAYLRAMHDRFGYPGLFAAYNAGPGRYAAHLASGEPLPAETVAYLATFGPDWRGHSRASASIVGGGVLFVRLSNAIPQDSDPPPSVAAAPGSEPALFVRLGVSASAQ